MEKLKPCPFCGGEAKFVTYNFGYQGGEVFFDFHIECGKCGLFRKGKYHELRFKLDRFGDVKTVVDERPQAIEKWNERVSDTYEVL